MDDAHAAAQPQHLPSVDRLLRQPLAQSLIAEHGHTLVASQARNLLDALRSQVLAGALRRTDLSDPALDAALAERVRLGMASRMVRVLNLTGTVIHTNFGRALLADEALAQVMAMMVAPNNLEYDLTRGQRGDVSRPRRAARSSVSGTRTATPQGTFGFQPALLR